MVALAPNNNGKLEIALEQLQPTRVCPIRHTTCIVLSYTLEAIPPTHIPEARISGPYTTMTSGKNFLNGTSYILFYVFIKF